MSGSGSLVQETSQLRTKWLVLVGCIMLLWVSGVMGGEVREGGCIG
jgi:hypothetical protein